MDFYSAYAQGFARVAACTLPVAIADPAANARAVLEQARACHDDGVAVAVFPELSLTGYSIDDLFLQDTLLEAVEAAVADLVAGTTDLLPVLVVGAPLVHGTRVLNCAVVIHRGRILGVAPKSYLPTYREFYERRWFAPGDDRRGEHHPGRPASRCRSGPTWSSRRPTCAACGCTSRSARTCGCRSRRAPRRRWPARRCWPTCPAARSPWPGPRTGGCWSAARARAAPRRTSSRPPARASRRPTSRGTARRWSTSAATCWGSPSGSPTARAAPSSTSTSTGSARSGCGRAPSTTTGAPTATRIRAFRTVGFELQPPTGDIGLRRKVDRFPFVPDDAERLALDCYEAYNIQVSGLEQRLHAMSTDTWQPKVVIGVSGGLDSTHALIVAAKAMDRLGRPREDIHAFTLPGFATGEVTKSYATRLAKSLGVTFEELDITGAAPHDARRPRPPVRRRAAGLRRHVRERPGRAAHRLPLPARQPPRRHRARHRRPLRAGARLVHLRRRRPDVALQRQRRRAEDADPAPDPLGRRRAASSTTTPTSCSWRSSSRRSPPS